MYMRVTLPDGEVIINDGEGGEGIVDEAHVFKPLSEAFPISHSMKGTLS